MTATGGDEERAGEVVLAHVSDLHFGAHDAAAVESLVEDLQRIRPTVTVVTGDLTQRARPHEFVAAVEFLGRLPSPRLVVLGNHDVPLDRLVRFTAPYQQYLKHVRLDLDPVVDADGVRVLGLQSMPAWRWKGGRVSRRQAGLVSTALAPLPAGTAPVDVVRVLALHHPLSATGAAAVVGRSRLLDALAQSRVEIVLAGHTHRQNITWLELPADDGSSWCVLEGVAGSATSTRLRGTVRSWTVYRLDATTITVEERCEAGSGWVTGGEWCFRRRTAQDG